MSAPVQHEALVRFLGVVQAVMDRVSRVTFSLKATLRAQLFLVAFHSLLLATGFYVITDLFDLRDQLAYKIAVLHCLQ